MHEIDKFYQYMPRFQAALKPKIMTSFDFGWNKNREFQTKMTKAFRHNSFIHPVITGKENWKTERLILSQNLSVSDYNS